MGQSLLDGAEANLIDCIERNWVSSGHYVARFEAEFARYLGVQHALAVSNGTAALHLILAALGVGPGDEVIVPALSFVATANAVRYTGAEPVFADVQPDTWCISAQAASELVNERTKAIIAVHLYGQMADMDALMALGLPVIEDACEALGASYRGRPAGSIGVAGAFSFYGNKTITTGEGGMVTTSDADLAERMRLLRGHAQERPYWHSEIGFNYRMSDLQAALGVHQMGRLPWFLTQREKVLGWYRRHLPSGARLQAEVPESQSGNWAAAMSTDKPAEHILHALADSGIEARAVFHPLNQLPMYSGDCPIAEQVSAFGVVLPTHPELQEEEVIYVCQRLEAAL